MGKFKSMEKKLKKDYLKTIRGNFGNEDIVIYETCEYYDGILSAIVKCSKTKKKKEYMFLRWNDMLETNSNRSLFLTLWIGVVFNHDQLYEFYKNNTPYYEAMKQGKRFYFYLENTVKYKKNGESRFLDNSVWHEIPEYPQNFEIPEEARKFEGIWDDYLEEDDYNEESN